LAAIGQQAVELVFGSNGAAIVFSSIAMGMIFSTCDVCKKSRIVLTHEVDRWNAIRFLSATRTFGSDD
jgi:hypothetical protein